MRCLIEIVSIFLLFTIFNVDGQRQGDLCVMAGTIQPGVCRHIMRCSAVLEAALQGIPYQVCASPENRLIVCCPWVPGQETGLQARCQANTTIPREGDNCTMVDTGRAGVCSQFANCQTAIEAASKGQSPQICAVEGTTPFICCPLVTVAEGDQCSTATGRTGKCLRISKCPVAVETAMMGKTPQICALDGSVPMVCCEVAVEADSCTFVDTGKTGVCRPFANCQTAKEAAFRGILPQICDVKGTIQNVCCPLETIVEGSNCTLKHTEKVGVCRPFANCHSAQEGACKGILPQKCDLTDNESELVCCTKTDRPPLPKGLVTQLPIASKAAEWSNCTLKLTGNVGVCRPFANCHSAQEGASKGIFPQKCDLTDNESELVCCTKTDRPPLPKGLVTQLPIASKAAEWSNCTLKLTGNVGVCRPFANCHSAQEGASKGIFPQKCDLTDNESELVCCTKTDRPPLPKGLVTQLPIASKAAEWSNCTLKLTGNVGVCRPFANCHSAQEGASKGIFPQRCDLTDNESELVCCTDCPPLQKGLVTQLPVGSKAADYCIELAEKIHPCQETRSGWTRGDLCPLLTPDSNILYHETPMTTTAEAPYYGQIGYGQRGAITWSGFPVSLVSDQWVLCSAYGIIGYIGSSRVNFVGLGGTIRPRYNPDKIYDVITQHIHPLYNHGYSYSYNSIALLQLDRRVTFTARILPVCLHTGTPLPDSGFILTGWDGSSGHKTTMQRVSQDECSRAFPTNIFHPAGVKHDQEICSRTVNTTGICPGWNSGSPLTLHNSHRVACTHLLVGLVSDEESCIFTSTRISSFIPWIEGIVWT